MRSFKGYNLIMLNTRPSLLSQLRQFVLVVLPFFIILAVGVFAHYYTLAETGRVSREANELLNVGLSRSVLNRELSGVVSDLLFLSSHIEKQGFIENGEIRTENVQELFYNFAKEKRLYDQIRLIDATGLERTRINFRDGDPERVPNSQLQDKSSRYYFNETMRLGPAEIYISPLDLNIEAGEIEQPIKPVMRFAIPIARQDGERFGILVLNFLGDRLIRDFVRASANIADHIFLLNAQGYWLYSPTRDQEWGFMLSHQQRFSKHYPVAWRAISESVSGRVETDEGLFTYETVTPGGVAAQTIGGEQTESVINYAHAPQWKVVSLLKPSAIKIGFGEYIRQHLTLYFVVMVVLLFGAWLLAEANLRHEQSRRQNEYERRFRQTLEDMQMVAVSLDREGHLTFCNDYFLQLTGWPRDEVLGGDWIGRFVAEESQPVQRALFEELQTDGELTTDMEISILARDGSQRRIAWHNTSSTNSQGEIVGYTAIGEDVTEQREAEEGIRKLSRAVEQSPSIVMMTDRKGNIEYVNPKFVEVTGYTADEVMGRQPSLLKSGEMPSEDYTELWETVRRGEVWRGEFHNRRKNGELYWESAAISALRDNAGNITSYVAVKEDITEHKKLEEQMAQRNKELAHAQSLAAMGRMASMVAHDLRNSLSSVKMGMQILSKSLSREQRELSQIGLDQIRYMENILTDMLTYARPEALKVEWLQLDKVIQAILNGLQRRIDETKVVLTFEPGYGLPAIPADANKLRQVFTNLIANALQSVETQPEEHRRVEVRLSHQLSEAGSVLHVIIEDGGAGISEEVKDHLFEPFFTTRTKGTGLGLAIVKQIVGQHHGEVTLINGENGGAIAEVFLPTSLVVTDEV